MLCHYLRFAKVLVDGRLNRIHGTQARSVRVMQVDSTR